MKKEPKCDRFRFYLKYLYYLKEIVTFTLVPPSSNAISDVSFSTASSRVKDISDYLAASVFSSVRISSPTLLKNFMFVFIVYIYFKSIYIQIIKINFLATCFFWLINQDIFRNNNFFVKLNVYWLK